MRNVPADVKKAAEARKAAIKKAGVRSYRALLKRNAGNAEEPVERR